jgi:hypothetical protein
VRWLVDGLAGRCAVVLLNAQMPRAPASYVVQVCVQAAQRDTWGAGV